MNLPRYIDTWAGDTTTGATTFDRCVRLYFLRRLGQKKMAHDASSSGVFAYGSDARPKLQADITLLAAEMKRRGFGRFRRLGEGTEAFVVSAYDLSNKQWAIRISEDRPNLTPHRRKLPCDDWFCFERGGIKPPVWVTIAPVADRSNVTWRDRIEVVKDCFLDNTVLGDASFDNIGHHLGHAVIIDFGCSFEKVTPTEAARICMSQIGWWLKTGVPASHHDQLLAFADSLMPHLPEKEQVRLSVMLPKAPERKVA